LFNHDNSRFKLGKNHKDVKCYKCHDQERTGTELFVNYKNNKIKCANCHS
jgi:Zn finger protein HypA/HybF involved in hydrogenase expression